MANRLNAKGFAEAKALNTDGKVRVSIRSFSNRKKSQTSIRIYIIFIIIMDLSQMFIFLSLRTVKKDNII